MPHLRPGSVPVLAVCLLVLVPAVVLAVSAARWELLDTSICDLGQDLMALAGCGLKKVERAADRGCASATLASECAREQEGKAFFKAVVKMVKRCRKVTKAAGRKGVDATAIPADLERTRLAARRLLLDAIEEVKGRPGFIDDDRLVRAVARAEDQVQRAKLALTGKKPYVRVFSAYRTAFDALRRVM